ncbi:MAG: alpha-glycosidase [Candidatus Rokuibacteriota bacterium]|nr:MAG: alpha-glycosidase [Candidatus Rokubacteria bacterium]
MPEGDADTVLLRYLRDGEARTVEASLETRADGEDWWRAELPLRNPVVPYRWVLAGGRGGYRWLNSTGAYPHEVAPGDDFRLVAAPGGPAWHLSSVGYEIFIDRFAPSAADRPPPDWAVPRDWGGLPELPWPDANRELFGGDLRGIEQHLDHVESLGANAIWLTPFFPAPSNHHYDPTSYDRVDPLVGGDEAFASLVCAARARQLRLIGDLLLDHCGSQHEWFVRAQADAASPERTLYLFDRLEAQGFASWRGSDVLPRFDWDSDELRSRMQTVVQDWLQRGLDGWRIGSAGAVGRHRSADLNADVARWLRGAAGDGLVVGEFWNDFRPDVDGLGWHGVMNYAGFMRPVWWWLRGDALGDGTFDVFTAAPAPTYAGGQATAVMQAFRASVPWEVTLHSWLLLDSHDTPRFRTVCGSRERQLVGVGLQMSMPGVPMVFAGAELGLEGASGHDARRTIDWDAPEGWDDSLLREYRRLIALRRSSDALACGGLRYLHVADDAIAYLRESRTDRVLCLAARAPHDPIPAPFSGLTTLYGDDPADGLLPSHGPAFHAWRIDA